MSDLIGGAKRIRHVYGQYVQSAFPLRSQALEAERDALLTASGDAGSPGVLAQDPLLEPITVYESSGKTLADVARDMPVGFRDVEHLGRELFLDDRRRDRKLYTHQVEALRRVAVDG